MRGVRFLDLKAAYSELAPQIDESLVRVARSGQYILGDEVEKFEAGWANFCGASYCVGVGTGLDAIELALRAVGVGPGDEVLVPSNTFVATWLAVDRIGAHPVPVDPDFQTFNITAEQAELSITSRTTAIVPVHLYGLPVDLDPILEMAQAYGLKVVEDAAQAHGARYRGDRIGAHGDAVAWSFYPGKNLGGLGDGGAITTDNESIAERLAVLRNYGSRRKYENEVKGTNSRLDPIQAGVLGVKLNVLDEWNLRRKRLAEIYGEGLGTMLSSSGNEVSSLNLQTKHPSPELLSTPVVPEFAESAWHLFVIRVQSRDWVRRRLLDDFGVETGIHYPIPPVRQKAFFDEVPAPFGVADGLAGQVLSLPMGPHLSEADASYVIESLAAVLGS